MAMKSLNDLFIHMLRDIFYAEKQALKGMRQMQRKASSEELKAAIEEHREQTEGQIETLTQVFEQLGLRPRGVTCDAVNGIIEEAQELMEEAAEGSTRDAAIVAAAQAVEHYEITRYGTMVAWAETLGHAEVAKMLAGIRDQESETDAKLSQLAEAMLNEHAAGGDGDEDTEMDADDEVDAANDDKSRKSSGRKRKAA